MVYPLWAALMLALCTPFNPGSRFRIPTPSYETSHMEDRGPSDIGLWAHWWVQKSTVAPAVSLASAGSRPSVLQRVCFPVLIHSSMHRQALNTDIFQAESASVLCFSGCSPEHEGLAELLPKSLCFLAAMRQTAFFHQALLP